MEYNRKRNWKLNKPIGQGNKYLNDKTYITNDSSVKTMSFQKKNVILSLFRNTYNYDIAFLSENISEWDSLQNITNND